MSLTAAAKTWITVCWLWVTAPRTEKTTGWSKTGVAFTLLNVLMNTVNVFQFNRENLLFNL